MNKWKTYAIVMTLITFGSLKETFRILTANDPDIADNRMTLIPFATVTFLFLSIRFWKKSSNSL